MRRRARASLYLGIVLPAGSIVTSAVPAQAPPTGVGDPEEARGGCRTTDARLAHRVLHPVAVRQEPRRAPLALQLGPDAGCLARQVSAGDDGVASRLRWSA